MTDILPTIEGDGGGREAVPVVIFGLDGSPALGSNSIDDSSLIRQALNEILGTYGDTVSVAAKAKSLNKFGSATVGTSWRTVQPLQGSELNETFVTTNAINAAISTDNSDTMSLVVEGHTIDGVGNLTFATQNVTLTGQTKVVLATPLARVTRAYAANSGVFGTDPDSLTPSGTVSFYVDADGDNGSGVPSTDSAVKMTLGPDLDQTRKCSTSISQGDYWILTGFSAAVTEAAAQTDFVTFRIEARDIANGGAWRPFGREIVALPDVYEPTPIRFKPYRIVPKNHDVRVQAITDGGNAPVFAELQGFLAQIQG